MESKDLNSSSTSDDPLDRWLASNLAQPPLSDAGFSARVATQIQPPRTSLGWLRILLCAIGAAAGTALFFYRGPNWDEIVASVSSAGDTLQRAASSPSTAPIVLGLIVSAVSLLIAFMPRSIAWPHDTAKPGTPALDKK